MNSSENRHPLRIIGYHFFRGHERKFNVTNHNWTKLDLNQISNLIPPMLFKPAITQPSVIILPFVKLLFEFSLPSHLHVLSWTEFATFVRAKDQGHESEWREFHLIKLEYILFHVVFDPALHVSLFTHTRNAYLLL